MTHIKNYLTTISILTRTVKIYYW